MPGPLSVPPTGSSPSSIYTARTANRPTTLVSDVRSYMDSGLPGSSVAYWFNTQENSAYGDYLSLNNNNNMVGHESVETAYANLPKRADGSIDTDAIRRCVNTARDYITSENNRASQRLDVGIIRENTQSPTIYDLLLGDEVAHVLRQSGIIPRDALRIGVDEIMNFAVNRLAQSSDNAELISLLEREGLTDSNKVRVAELMDVSPDELSEVISVAREQNPDADQGQLLLETIRSEGTLLATLSDIADMATIKPVHTVRENIQNQNNAMQALSQMSLESEEDIRNFLQQYQLVTGTSFSCDAITNAEVLGHGCVFWENDDRCRSNTRAFGLMENVTDALKTETEVNAAFNIRKGVESSVLQKFNPFAILLPALRNVEDLATRNLGDGQIINPENLTYDATTAAVGEGLVQGVFSAVAPDVNILTRTAIGRGAVAAATGAVRIALPQEHSNDLGVIAAQSVGIDNRLNPVQQVVAGRGSVDNFIDPVQTTLEANDASFPNYFNPTLNFYRSGGHDTRGFVDPVQATAEANGITSYLSPVYTLTTARKQDDGVGTAQSVIDPLGSTIISNAAPNKKTAEVAGWILNPLGKAADALINWAHGR